MRKTLLALVLGVSVAAIAAGCAQPPQSEIESANQAFDAATTSEAQTYAANSYKAAQDAKSQLDAELTAQEEKFALFRSYSRTSELAASATTAAEKAEKDASAEKDRIRAETTKIIADTRTALDETTHLLEKAPRGKGSQADIAAMKADLATVGTALGEAESALSAGKLMEARSKAEAAMKTVQQTKGAIEQAQAMKSGAKPRR